MIMKGRVKNSKKGPIEITKQEQGGFYIYLIMENSYLKNSAPSLRYIQHTGVVKKEQNQRLHLHKNGERLIMMTY